MRDETTRRGAGEAGGDQIGRVIAQVGETEDAKAETLPAGSTTVGQLGLIDPGVEAPSAFPGAGRAGFDASPERLDVHGNSLD
jgi:hypothetical protein